MRISTWNVNGIRACAKNGFLKWLSEETPDVVCVQEAKALEEDLDDMIRSPFGYRSSWFPAQKKGYSGVGIYYKRDPLNLVKGMGVAKFDQEGRVITAEFEKFFLVNAYFPNSQRDHARLGYKLEFCDGIQDYCNKLSQKKGLILCGDFNIAHQEIDLANPKTNINNAGFLPEERRWLDQFLKTKFVDAFRHFDQSGGKYTWWSYRPGVREKNIGWRLDYHLVSKNFMGQIKNSVIENEVTGSDHCPVTLEL